MPQCILLSSLVIISSYFTSVLLKTSFRFEFPRALLKVWDDLENPISLPWVGAWALIVFMSPSDSMGQKRLRTTPLVCPTNQKAAKRLRIQSRDSKLIQSRDIKITPLYSSGKKKMLWLYQRYSKSNYPNFCISNFSFWVFREQKPLFIHLKTFKNKNCS